MVSEAGRALRIFVVALVATVFMLVGLVPMGSLSYPVNEAPDPVGETASAGSTDHFLEITGLDAPQTYLAELDPVEPYEASSGVVRATITSAHLVSQAERSVAESVTVEVDWSHRLVGRTVVASVTDEAAQVIGKASSATVELFAVPNGSTVTLLIGRVMSAAVSAASTSATVSSLSVSNASPGSPVTVYGTGFGATQLDSWVTVCGARAAVVSWSNTAITFTVPEAARNPGYVGVVVSGSTSNGVYFTPYTAPRLTSVTPQHGAAGTTVSFKGTGFGATQDTGWVSFAGTLGQVVSWSDTEVRAIVPRGAAAGYAGVVARGLSSNGIFYAPYGSPVIQSVSPAHAVVGSTLTVTGSDFGNARGRLLIGGVEVPVTSWSTTRITATVPAGVSSGYVGVLREGSQVSNGVFVAVAPRLRSLSSWWSSPGATLTINGEGFGASQGTKSVYICGTVAEVVSWSDTVVTARVPASARSGYVGIGTPNACSNGIYLVVQHQARIESVSDTTVRPGLEITVTGREFGDAGSGVLAIDGSQLCDVVAWNDTRIVARIPAGATSGYLGVIKQGVASNGVWLNTLPAQ